MNSITNLLTGMEEQEGFQLENDEYHMESEDKEVTPISLQNSIVLECESLSDISQELEKMSVCSLVDVEDACMKQVSIDPPSEPDRSVAALDSAMTAGNAAKLESTEDETTEDTTGTISHEVTGCETC